MSMTRRVVLGTVAILAIAMMVSVWVAVHSLGRDLERQTMADLTRTAHLVQAALGGDRTGWQALVRDLGARNGIRITLIDSSGTVLADSDIPNPGRISIANHARRPEVVAALAGEVGRARRRSETVGTDLVYVAVPGGPAVVRVAVGAGQIDRALRRSLTSVAWAALLALLVGTGLSFLAVRSVTGPLRGLSSAARAIAAGHMPRFPRSGVTEIDALVISLREMHRQLTDKFEELRREQAESSALVGAMVEGVLATDPEGRIVTANPAARVLLGYGPDDPLPPLPILFRVRDARSLVTAVLAGEALSREVELDGVTLFISARPLPEGGAVLVLHDLTGIRRQERIRRDFVANVSHELKTPLTSIAGYAETLLGGDADDSTARRFLEIIRSNAGRMQSLVDDLLDLSRIESGRWQPRPETVDFKALMEEEWASRSYRAGQRTCTIDGVPQDLELMADRTAVRQILGNLLDNAIRHTGPDGHIRCRAQREGAGVRLSVQDDGTGILSEHLPRIFERFYRADEGRSRDEGGTGLGLAIVKHLVEAHGGRVAATSLRASGTTIECWFPA